MMLTKEGYQSWMTARVKELERDHPKRLKRDCWRTAQKEWLEIRVQQKRAARAGYSGCRLVYHIDELGKVARIVVHKLERE